MCIYNQNIACIVLHAQVNLMIMMLFPLCKNLCSVPLGQDLELPSKNLIKRVDVFLLSDCLTSIARSQAEDKFGAKNKTLNDPTVELFAKGFLSKVCLQSTSEPFIRDTLQIEHVTVNRCFKHSIRQLYIEKIVKYFTLHWFHPSMNTAIRDLCVPTCKNLLRFSFVLFWPKL